MAVGVDQHAQVVGRLAVIRVGFDEVRQAQRDHGLAQAVLHRLVESEVGGVRQGRHEFGDPDSARVVPHEHSVLFGRPVW